MRLVGLITIKRVAIIKFIHWSLIDLVVSKSHFLSRRLNAIRAAPIKSKLALEPRVHCLILAWNKLWMLKVYGLKVSLNVATWMGRIHANAKPVIETEIENFLAMLLFWVIFLREPQWPWGQDACHELQRHRFKPCQGPLLHVSSLPSCCFLSSIKSTVSCNGLKIIHQKTFGTLNDCTLTEINILKWHQTSCWITCHDLLHYVPKKTLFNNGNTQQETDKA